MAAKTTSAAGAFDDGSKWAGSIAPVSGADTLTINHAMTWAPSASSSFTVGTGSGVALTFGTTGSLTITGAGDFTLTLAGSTAGGKLLGREFIVNATNGAVTINIDATGAGAGFTMLVGNSYDNGNLPYNAGGWALNGNATYGITVQSLPSDGSKNSNFSGGSNGARNHIDASYVTFRRIGTASVNAFAPHMDVRNKKHTWNRVTLESCGEIAISGDANWTESLSYTGVVSTSTLTDGSTKFPLNVTFGAGTGTRTFTGCVWDKTIKIIAPRGLSFVDSYFHNGWSGTAGTSTGGTWDRCFVRQTFDSLITSFGITNSFRYWDNPAGSNVHWDSLNGSAIGTVTYTHTGNVYYYNGNDAGGNVIIAASSNTTMSVVANNNLVLPNGAGLSSGTFITSNGAVGNGFSITANHNTLNVKGTHGFEIGHLLSGADTTNRYTSVKSNLFIGGTTGYKCFDVDPVLITDLMTPGNTNYNGSYQIKTTSGTGGFTNEGRGYAAKWSVTPGANDVDGQDPQFVDSTVSLAKWDLSLGGVGTDAAAAARIKADPSLTASLVSYIRAGYAIRNPIYRNAGHDGVTIGAQEFVSASSRPSAKSPSVSLGVGL